jgi:hypothetical protein
MSELDATATITETPVETTPAEATPEQVEAPTPDPTPVTWENAFEGKFDKAEPDVSETEVKDPSAPFPSDKAKPEEAESTDAAALIDEKPDEEPDIAEILEAKGDPFSFSRKELRKVEKEVLVPFRNPEVPINDVVTAFHKFNPLRTEEMVQTLVESAISAYPDDWVKQITGLDLTVEDIKNLANAEPQTPHRPEQSDDDSTEKYLTGLYGEEWRDKANDANLLDDDVQTARAYRQVLELKALVKNGDPEKQAKLDKAISELEELKPQVDAFKKYQDAQFENERSAIYNATVQEYRGAIEQHVIPKLFKEVGLETSEQDTDTVKNMKEYVRDRFSPVYGEASDFDMFVGQSYSGKDALGKTAQRVKTYFENAADFRAKAKTATKTDAASHIEKADSLEQLALKEQNTLKVLYKAAATEFVSSPQMKSLIGVLEENANLRRQQSKSGRKEIIGSTVTSTDPNAWKEELKKAENKWDDNAIRERFAEAAR